MTPTSKLPKSTQPVSTASIAVERPSANHLNETNNDDPPSVSQLPQSQQTSSGSQLGQEGELAGVVDSVLKRATPGQPTLLLFVGSEANRHVDSTSAMVASILAKRRLGTVLLIDSNADSRELTFSSGQQNQPGLVEAVLEQAPWSPMIRKGAASGVDFMPLGKRDFSGTRFQPRLRQLVADLKQAYDYICVSAGSSDSVDARLWSDISDGLLPSGESEKRQSNSRSIRRRRTASQWCPATRLCRHRHPRLTSHARTRNWWRWIYRQPHLP